MGYGLSVAGHVIIALLLMLEVYERFELSTAAAIQVEIVMEKPAVARPDTSASSEAVSALNGQIHPSGIPAVADIDKRAKAPLATLNLNGIDRTEQPGYDGRDPSVNQFGVPLPRAPDAAFVSRGLSAPSRTMVIAPVGPTPPQATARELGQDEVTVLQEQKVECGVRAKRPTPTVAARRQARVSGVATEAQALAIMRSNQALLENQRLFAESLDGARKFIVVLPSGLTVNVGDVIQYDEHHIDPSNSCQFIPPLVVSKL
jgi:hypothetical protein